MRDYRRTFFVFQGIEITMYRFIRAYKFPTVVPTHDNPFMPTLESLSMNTLLLSNL